MTFCETVKIQDPIAFIAGLTFESGEKKETT